MTPTPRKKRTRRAPTPGARLLTTREAAAYTGWPYTTLRDLALGIRSRMDRDPVPSRLPCVRIPGVRSMWFDRADLDAAIVKWKR